MYLRTMIFGLRNQLRKWKPTWIQGHNNQTNDFGRLSQEEDDDKN